MCEFNECLLQAADFEPVSLQAPDNWVGHLPFAAWLMKTMKPSLFVELGTHSGNSYFSFCQAARAAGIQVSCFAVDTWEGDEHAGPYSNSVFERVSEHNQTHYANISRLLRMTFDDAVNYFDDGTIDLLHIDGLHTYDAVKHDFETWLIKLAPGAIVLFHDINVRERNFGVWKLWEELKQRYPEHIEFMHSHGLGVLRIDGATDAASQPWLIKESVEQKRLRTYFSVLGTRLLERTAAQSLRIRMAEAVADRDKHIANLVEAISDRDRHIANLGEVIADRDRNIASLVDAVAGRDRHAASLAGQINALHNSTS